MAGPTFKAGELYASRSQVRAHFREFWKGILVRDGRVAIIQTHKEGDSVKGMVLRSRSS